ncbi:hypothetical protein AnigIFM49718_007449 [Aspergillus niger]|nr:hypothetical protein AnigIFM49718_007449 [Aspergillus niger]
MGIELTSPESSRSPSPVLRCALTAKAEAILANNCLSYNVSVGFNEACGVVYLVVVHDKFGVEKLTLQNIRRFEVAECQLNHFLEEYPVEGYRERVQMQMDLQSINYAYDHADMSSH